MSSIQDITFPEDWEIIKSPSPNLQAKIKTPPALDFIIKLLYRSGTSLSLVYILSILVIQPLLEVQYDRILNFSQHVLKKARDLLRLIGQTRPLPVVAVKHGDKLYSDAQIQTESASSLNKYSIDRCDITDTPAVSFKDEPDSSKPSIKDKLHELTNTLVDYNKYCCDLNELGPLTFQLKKFQGVIEGYNHATIFKTGRLMAGESSGTEIRSQIRTIKGWYLTGQI